MYGCWLYRQVLKLIAVKFCTFRIINNQFFPVSFTLISQKPTFCLLCSRSSAVLCTRYTAETLSKQLPVLHTYTHTHTLDAGLLYILCLSSDLVSQIVEQGKNAKSYHYILANLVRIFIFFCTFISFSSIPPIFLFPVDFHVLCRIVLP